MKRYRTQRPQTRRRGFPRTAFAAVLGLIAAIGLALLPGCGAGGSTTTPLHYLDPPAPTVTVGGDSVKLVGKGGKDLPVLSSTLNWSSSDSSVANVDGYGNVTGVGPGTALITAVQPYTGQGAFVTVTVNRPSA